MLCWDGNELATGMRQRLGMEGTFAVPLYQKLLQLKYFYFESCIFRIIILFSLHLLQSTQIEKILNLDSTKDRLILLQ